MNAKKRQKRRRTLWLLLGLLTLFLIRIGRRHPQFVESFYGEFTYPVIRQFFHYTFGKLSVPGIVFVLLLVIALLIFRAVMPAVKGKWTWKSLLMGFASTAGAILFLFYFLWGFNYQRDGLMGRMELDAPPLDTAAIRAEFDIATQQLVDHAELHAQAILEGAEQFDRQLEKPLANALKEQLSQLGYGDIAIPRGRVIRPKGILMRFSTAGIYIPMSGEGHVDAGMHPLQIPFTMTHELAHGFGVTDEGECNFAAYMICSGSSDPVVRFSALITYWRYIAYEFRNVNADSYQDRRNELPDVVVEVLRQIRENNALYPDIMPRARDKIYDTYLKSNGIKEGLVSYNSIVRMVSAYRKSTEDR